MPGIKTAVKGEQSRILYLQRAGSSSATGCRNTAEQILTLKHLHWAAQKGGGPALKPPSLLPCKGGWTYSIQLIQLNRFSSCLPNHSTKHDHLTLLVTAFCPILQQLRFLQCLSEETVQSEYSCQGHAQTISYKHLCLQCWHSEDLSPW